ncbi:MAG: D-lyxose/D-mannose family sugar isomerase, partial [Promethearchaeota archaeon]
MKRSKINELIIEAIELLNNHQFYLPKFAYWRLKEWESKENEIEGIIEQQLGWDITDYGSGNFSELGLIHFTIRNGNVQEIERGGKPYCEKIMILDQGQATPIHHHRQKIEDIINRGNGILCVQIYSKTIDNKLGNSLVVISIDGVKKTVESGTIIELEPGQSVTLKPDHFHKFWGKEGTVQKFLIGEVSTVNDDYTDNCFLNNIRRFTEIEEDEPPMYLLY